MFNILIIVLFFLGTVQVTHPFIYRPNVQRKTSVAVLSSTADDRDYLYRQEPTALQREEIDKEEGNPKHSTFHVVRGPGFIDDKADPAHSFHHHLIDVDHDKLDDLGLRAQKAWMPVNVHEMDVDAGEFHLQACDHSSMRMLTLKQRSGFSFHSDGSCSVVWVVCFDFVLYSVIGHSYLID